MDFFEKQMRVITGKGTALESSKRAYIGRSCYITLSGDRLARLDFVLGGTYEKYECLEITILDKNKGCIDKLTLCFEDIFASQRVGNGDTMTTPYIWIYRGETSWYKQPTISEIKTLAQTAHDYISLFA